MINHRKTLVRAALRVCIFSAVLAVTAAVFSPKASAVNYSWTNNTSNASGFWSNGVLWGNASTLTYPGSAAGDSAYLTNSFNGTQTNILNSRLVGTIGTLAISNGLGQTWLIVTNGASSVTSFTNTTLSIGTGGRLQIDSGGVVTGITAWSWLGTNGTIYLNNNGKLFSNGGLTIGASGAAAVTATVTSVSGPGNGGVWNFHLNNVTVGNSGNDNLFLFNNGVTATNVGNITMSGNRNSLIFTNGSKFYGQGALTFSGTGYGNTVVLGDGIYNLNNSGFSIGGGTGSSNNTFISYGTVTGANSFVVSGVIDTFSTGNNNNTVIMTNGGFWMTSAGAIEIGAARNQQPGGGNTTIILSNSYLWGNTATVIGSGSTNNNVTLLNSSYNNGNNILYMGGWAQFYGASNNIYASGSTFSNFGAINIGITAGAGQNRMTLDNGSVLSNFQGLYVGGAVGGAGVAAANENSFVATNGSRVFLTTGGIAVGATSGGAAGGNNNFVILTNSVLLGNSINTIGSGTTNNSLTVLDNSVWNMGNGGLTIGANGGVNNSVRLNGVLVTNMGALLIGSGVGASTNILIAGDNTVLSNVTTLFVSGNVNASIANANANKLIVTNKGSGLFMTTPGTIAIGAAQNQQPGGSDNVVILSNSVLSASGNFTIGNHSTNNIVTILEGSVWNNNANPLYLGGWAPAAGFTLGGSNNLLTVSGALMTNFSTINVGVIAGAAGNRVILRDGAILSNITGLVVGADRGANGSQILVTNGSRIFMRTGAVAVGSGTAGAAGANNDLLVLTNSLLTSSSTTYLGSGSTNNTILVQADTVWNHSNLGGLTVGTGLSSNNVFLINGGIVSNLAGLTLGNAYNANYNQIVVTNGGRLQMSSGQVLIGSAGNNTVGGGNNLLVLTNSSIFSGAITVMGSGSSNNTLMVLGDTLWNANNLSFNLGQLNSSSNLVYVNGGVLSNLGAITIGGSANSQYNQLIVTNGGKLTMSSGALLVGAANGAGNNQLLVSNGTFTVSQLTVGTGGSNNVAIFQDSGINGGGGGITVGTGFAVSNSVLLSGSVMTNVGGLSVGGTAGANYNSFVVTNGSQFVMTTGGFFVGAGFNSAAGGSYNTVIISNGVITVNSVSTDIAIGSGATNNTVTFLDTRYNNAGKTLNVGAGQSGGGTISVGNTLTVNGGMFSNVGAIVIGSGTAAQSTGNGIIVTNNGTFTTTQVTLGTGGATSNFFVIDGGASALGAYVTNSGAFIVGTAGGSANRLSITNGTLNNLGALNIGTGTGSSNNQVIVYAGGVITNVGGLNMGTTTGANNNSLISTNGGGFFMRTGNFNIGLGGGGNNTVILSNAFLATSAIPTIGSGSASNLVVLLGNATMNAGNLGLTIGTATGVSNSLVLNGGSVTNIGTLGLGNSATSKSNSIIIANGGVMSNVTYLNMGVAYQADYNSLIVTNGGRYIQTGGDFFIGMSFNGGVGGGNNVMIVSNSSITSSHTSNEVGMGGGSSNNVLTLLGDTVMNLGNFSFTVGKNAATGNVMTVNGALVTNGTSFVVGSGAGANANFLIVTNGGLVRTTGGTTIGNAANSNIATVVGGPGTNSSWDMGNTILTIGTGAAWSNALNVNAGGTVLNGGIVVSASTTSISNQLNIVGGTLYVTNSGGTAALRNGSADTSGGSGLFNLQNGTIVADVFTVTNLSGGVSSFNFQSGTTSVLQAKINSASPGQSTFVVGNGVNAALLQVRSNATHTFFSGLTLTNNSLLKGTGTINAGTAGVIVKSGSVFSPGNSPGTLAVSSMTWEGNGQYLMEISDFASTAGVGWDFLNVTGQLTINSSLSNPFIIKMDSLGANALNFDGSTDIGLLIASFGSQSGYSADKFTVDTSSFSNSPSSPWGVLVSGNNLYLTYSAYTNKADFVWGYSNSTWNTAAAYTNNAAPAGPVPNDQLQIQFGTNTVSQFTASNDVARSINAILLNSASAATNGITGASITFVGDGAAVVQQNGGAFVFSNQLVLATNLVFRGVGAGRVIIASNITGSGQITKKGGWNLELRGSNTFEGPVLVDGLSGMLTLNSLYALGTNSITVSNGTVFGNNAVSSYVAGNGWNNQNILVTGANSMWTNPLAMVIGAAGGTNTTVTVDNAGVLKMATLTLGTNGSGYSSLVITNNGSVVNLSGGGAFNYIGFNTSNNLVKVTDGGSWNLANGTIIMGGISGTGGTGTGNVLRVESGGLVTNLFQLYVGFANAGGSSQNSVIVTNGGKLFAGGIVNVGSGGSSNSIVVNGGSQASANSTVANLAGAVTVGSGSAGVFNFLLMTNGVLISNGGTIGNAASSNSVTILANGTWNANNNKITVGVTGSGIANNSILVNGGMLTNVNALIIGGNGGAGSPSSFNNLIVTNGGQVYIVAGETRIGDGGAVGNKIIIDNGTFNSAGILSVGVGPVGTAGGSNILQVLNGGFFTSTRLTVGFWANGGTTATSSSNTVLVAGANGSGAKATVRLGGLGLGIGSDLNSSFNTMTIGNNGVATNTGSISIGMTASSFNNALIVTNGGQLYSGAVTVGGNTNSYIINGGSVGSIVSNGTIAIGTGLGNGFNRMIVSNAQILSETLTNGFGMSNNVVTVLNGTRWNLQGSNAFIGVNAATGNVVNVAGGSMSNIGAVVVGVGAASNNRLQLDGGTVWANSLIVTSAGNRVALNGGTLAVTGNTAYSNGTDFVVGDGTQSATFNTVTGTHLFQNNVVVTNNGVLAGSGNVTVGPTAQTIIKSGGVLAPGIAAGSAMFTNTGTLVFQANGAYQWQVNDFGGTTGSGWDFVQINGALLNTASSGTPFAIDITSLNATNGNGLSSGFSKDGTFDMVIATASGGITSFNAANYALVLTNFQNPYDGVWTLLQQGNNLVLDYQGSTNFVWTSNTSNFSGAGNWIVGNAPPSDTTNVVMYFGGTGSQAYKANNDLVGLVTKRIVLTNNSTATQYIVGNAFSLAGVAPEIQQNGAGAVVISNALTIGTDTALNGTGSGTLTLSGTLSGSRGLTKTGAYSVVMNALNTYSGSTFVNDGTVNVRNNGALSSSTQLVVNALGTVMMESAAPVVRQLGGSGSVILSNASALTVLNASGSSTFAGVISGDGSLTKDGAGEQVLSGNNLYSGNTLVLGGTLTVSGSLASTNVTAAGIFSMLNWANPTALTNVATVVLGSGGVLNMSTDGTLASVVGSGTISLNARTLNVGFGDVTTNFGGNATGSGTLSKIGAGTLTINNLGTLAIGNIAVNEGWLVESNSGIAVTSVRVNNGATFTMDAGTMSAANLTVVSGGRLLLNGGTLAISSGSISNGQDLVVGGAGSPVLQVLSGVAHFEKDLIATNNGVIKGGGTILVNSGAGSVRIQDGGVLAPGNSPGTMNIGGNLVWQSGGSYQVEVNDFTGSKGTNPGWDWVNVMGNLTNDATSLNPFVIDITSLNGSSAGAAANFDYNGTYSMIIATANNVINFNTNSIVLSTANFANPFDGVFTLSLQNGTNVVLSYAGIAGFAWKDINGNFSDGTKWVGGVPPSASMTNVTLYFGGAAPGAYSANNDLTGLVTKKVTLTNITSVTQTITGNAITLGGLNPEIDQNGSGKFNLANDWVLATNVLLTGTGNGQVTFSGNLSGIGGLTKTGVYVTVVSGSNTYSGVTVVRDGKLVIASTYGLSGSTLSNLVNNGVVISNVTSVAIGGLAGNVNLGLTNTAGAGVATDVGGNNQSTTYSGVLSGSGSLSKSGSGTLTVTAVNTYTGGTTINNGMLVAGTLTSGIGASGSSLGTGTVTLNGGTLRFGTGSLLRVTNTVAGLIVFNGGTLDAAHVVNQGQVNVIGNTTTITTDFLNPTGYLDMQSGVLVVNGQLINNSVISNATSTILRVGSTGTGMFTNTGTIAMSGGTVAAGVLTNSGTVSGYGTVSATLYNSQYVSATNGTLNLMGTALGAGAYRAEAGAVLNFAGGGTISSLSNTGGFVQVTSSTLVNNSQFENGGTLLLSAGGVYSTTTRMTNGVGSVITGGGTLISAATLVNQGTILAQFSTPLVLATNVLNEGVIGIQGAGRLQVNGVFTNNGTLQSFNGVGTYTSSTVNRGAWITDGLSKSVFQSDFKITTNGYVLGTSSGLYVFNGNLINQSTNNTAWNTLDYVPGSNSVGVGTTFLFAGTGVTHTQVFQTMGLQLTGGFVGTPNPSSNGVQDVVDYASTSGFFDNYAVGQLWLTNTTLMLAQAVPTNGVIGALFVDNLDLFGSSQLIISNNMTLYFVHSNSWSMANVTLLGNAQIHQLNALNTPLTLIPEPNVLVLWLSGAATFFLARRRRRSRK